MLFTFLEHKIACITKLKLLSFFVDAKISDINILLSSVCESNEVIYSAYPQNSPKSFHLISFNLSSAQNKQTQAYWGNDSPWLFVLQHKTRENTNRMEPLKLENCCHAPLDTESDLGDRFCPIRDPLTPPNDGDPQ